MDLLLFCVLLGLSLVLIGLGLAKSEHTELSLIGFLFLFLLALMISSQQIEYKTGFQSNTTYSYSEDGNLTFTSETTLDLYDNSTLGDQAHNFGYWLAVGSFIGFAGVLLSLRREKF